MTKKLFPGKNSFWKVQTANYLFYKIDSIYPGNPSRTQSKEISSKKY
jgi:hypothetical protein